MLRGFENREYKRVLFSLLWSLFPEQLFPQMMLHCICLWHSHRLVCFQLCNKWKTCMYLLASKSFVRDDIVHQCEVCFRNKIPHCSCSCSQLFIAWKREQLWDLIGINHLDTESIMFQNLVEHYFYLNSLLQDTKL